MVAKNKISSEVFDKKVSMEYKISLAETDSVGVVYFANYFMLFEKGHMEFLYKAGINNFDLINKGIYMPIREAQCSFKQALRYGDTVIIETSLKYFKKASLEFNYNVLKKGSSIITATGFTIHTFANKEFKPTKIPLDIEKALIQYLNQ